MTLVSKIPNFHSIGALNLTLKETGCTRCSLGFQPNINGCCVSRGPIMTSKMLVGEAPGKDEDSTREPFTGPAGRLMDRIWASVGMNTNDWYLTNTVLCRPVAPYGSGKQNLTPKAEQKDKCRPYLDEQIRLLKPRLIVTVGAVACAAILGARSIRMGDYRSKLIRNLTLRDWVEPPQFDTLLFPMLHPAAILHAQRDPAKHTQYRQWMWNDIRELKKIIDKEGL